MEEISTTEYCKNCGEPLNGKFCSNCGQSANTHRINFHFLIHEIQHGIFHVDKGILYTIKELFTRPGKTIKEYLAGKRVKHFKPVALVFILGTLLAFADHSLSTKKERSEHNIIHINDSTNLKTNNLKSVIDSALKTQDSSDAKVVDSVVKIKKDELQINGKKVKFDYERGKSIGEAITHFYDTHFALFILLLLPIIALSLYLAYLAYGKYNYTEYLIICCFLAAQALLIHTIFIPIKLLLPNIGGFRNFIIFVFSCWTIFELFAPRKRKSIFMRLIFSWFILAILFTAVTVIAVAIILPILIK